MALFQRHKLERNGNGYTIILYMDPGLAEFAEEFGKNNNGSQSKLTESVRRYVKERFPNLKVTAAKVMVGSMLAASIPLGGAAFAAEDTAAANVQAQVQAEAALQDVIGTKYENSVKMLNALGVIQGYEDGTFKPDRTITRAEFAKIAVYAAGYGDTAEILGGQSTGFTDVPATHWASKYILVAKERGLMEGVGNNAFNPESQVTYEQVVTVLQRIQGYSDDGLIGNWPTNHVIQATQQGIIGNTNFKVGSAANRGDVSILLTNVLEKPLVKYNTDTKRFENVTGDKTLLDEAFGDTLKSGFIDTSDDEFRIGYETATGIQYISMENVQLTLIGAKSLQELLGNEVSYMKLSDNSYLVMNNQDSANVKSGKLDGAVNFGSADPTVKFEGSTATYKVADEDVIYYVNGVRQPSGTTPSVDSGKNVKIFLNDDGDIRFVSITDYEPTMVMSEVIAPTKLLNGRVTGTYYVEGTGDVEESYTIPKDRTVTVFRNGSSATLADLTKDDVLYVVRDGTNVVKIEAYSSIVTGTVTKIKSGTGTYVQLDGVDYQVSTEALEDANAVADYTVGTKYSVILDRDGKIIDKFTPAGADATKVTGMFLKAESVGKVENNRVVNYNAVTLLTSDGAQKTYLVSKDISSSIEDDTNNNTKNIVIGSGDSQNTLAFSSGEPDDATRNVEGVADIVTLSLDKDGNVIGVSDLVSQNTTVAAEKKFTGSGTVGAVTANDITIGGTTYRLADNVMIFDQVNGKVLTRADLKEDYVVSFKVNANNAFYVEKLVITGGTPDLGAADAVTGLYQGHYTQLVGDETQEFITVLVGGKERNLRWNADAAAPTIADNTLVTVQDTGNDTQYDRVLVAGIDTTGFDPADVNITPTAISTNNTNFAVDKTAKTFQTDAAKFIVDADTTIYVKDGNEVTLADFTAISSLYASPTDKVANATITVVNKVNADGEVLTYGANFNRANTIIVDMTNVAD